MPKPLRPIGHDDRLSIVDHLDELRTRLVVSAVVVAVAFAGCFWQNHALLNLLNRALPASQKTAANHLNGLTGDTVNASHYLHKASTDTARLAQSRTFSAGDRALFRQIAQDDLLAARALPQSTPKRLPITIGIGEPFTTTLTVVAYFALLFSLPMLIYEAYAFLIPALNPNERRLAVPMMIVAPVLFIAGVVFAYLAVLPPAVKFLQGYNSQDFDILVQAKTYYKFEIFTMLGIGLAFEVPLLLLTLQRAGVIDSRTLTGNWRYAVVIIAVVAAALPGVDPVTMGLEMLPLVLLYLASIVMLKIVDRRDAARAAAQLSDDGERFDPI
ncbi:MAG: twin-arginine translocase subunit TatC [Solirubrobacteraceae bacterium]